MGASIQEKYGKREKGFLGGVANSNPATTENGVTAEATFCGKFIKNGANGVENLASATDKIAGVLARTDALDKNEVAAEEDVTILKIGSIFVHCETSCTKGDKVFVRHTKTTNTKTGDVRNDADTDKAVEINATFSETISSAGIVEIQVNL